MEYEKEQERLEELGIDGASKDQTLEALLQDERAAVDAYEVAIKNFEGKVDDNVIKALEEIKADELDHIKKIEAILKGENFEEIG